MAKNSQTSYQNWRKGNDAPPNWPQVNNAPVQSGGMKEDTSAEDTTQPPSHPRRRRRPRNRPNEPRAPTQLSAATQPPTLQTNLPVSTQPSPPTDTSPSVSASTFWTTSTAEERHGFLPTTTSPTVATTPNATSGEGVRDDPTGTTASAAAEAETERGAISIHSRAFLDVYRPLEMGESVWDTDMTGERARAVLGGWVGRGDGGVVTEGGDDGCKKKRAERGT